LEGGGGEGERRRKGRSPDHSSTIIGFTTMTRTINICKKIQCPYFSDDHRKSYGCRRYLYSRGCHLAIGKPHVNLAWSEYYLSVGDASISDAELLQWQKENNRFFQEDPQYTDDILFFEENPDWAQSTFVPGKLKTHLRSETPANISNSSNTF